MYRWTEKLPAAETPSVVVQEPIANYSMKEEEVESENYEWKELDSRWDKFFIKKKSCFKYFNISCKLAFYQGCH